PGVVSEGSAACAAPDIVRVAVTAVRAPVPVAAAGPVAAQGGAGRVAHLVNVRAAVPAGGVVPEHVVAGVLQADPVAGVGPAPVVADVVAVRRVEGDAVLGVADGGVVPQGVAVGVEQVDAAAAVEGDVVVSHVVAGRERAAVAGVADAVPDK